MRFVKCWFASSYPNDRPSYPNDRLGGAVKVLWTNRQARPCERLSSTTLLLGGTSMLRTAYYQAEARLAMALESGGDRQPIAKFYTYPIVHAYTTNETGKTSHRTSCPSAQTRLEYRTVLRIRDKAGALRVAYFDAVVQSNFFWLSKLLHSPLGWSESHENPCPSDD